MTGEYNPPVSEAWMSDALCATTDPAIFHPEKGESARQAKSVCVACPVIAECQVFADLQSEPYGVLAGQAAWERRKARSTRRTQLMEEATA